jgi:hypothetical protein
VSDNSTEQTTAATDLMLAVQAKKSLRLTLVWQFDHNGVYHLIQAVGLLFLLAGLRRSLLGG